MKCGSCGFYSFFRNPEESFYIVIRKNKGYSLWISSLNSSNQVHKLPWTQARGNLPCTPLVPHGLLWRTPWHVFPFHVWCADVQMCSWWPARLPALCLPSFKAEERARVSNRDMDDWTWRNFRLWRKSWSYSPPCAVDREVDRTAAFYLGRGDCSYRGNWPQVGSLVTRETSRGQPLTAPVISWVLGPLGRKVSPERRCRGSGAWSSSVWTESKRTATLSCLSLQLLRPCSSAPVCRHRSNPGDFFVIWDLKRWLFMAGSSAHSRAGPVLVSLRIALATR